jgi:hypothetical protein
MAAHALTHEVGEMDFDTKKIMEFHLEKTDE